MMTLGCVVRFSGTRGATPSTNECLCTEEDSMVFNKLSACVVLSSIVATVGCSAAAPEPEGASASRILNGKVDLADPAVVAVIAFQKTSYSTCTGEVIAPNVVLTAGHCVDIRALGFVPDGISIVTSRDTATATAKDVLRTKAAFAHPQYDPKTGANDIAIVLLEQATTIAPLAYSRVALEGNDGKSARIIGYGTTKDGDSSTAGQKNEATVKLSQINGHDFVAATLPTTQCHGDSGGPVLLPINGKETIIGIGWITVRNDGLCSEGVRNTRVDQFLSFIDPFVQASGGNPGGSGTPGAPGAPGGSGGGGTSKDVCCHNGHFFACPTAAACLGGFDLDGCLNACNDAACEIACTKKLAGVSPTNQCTAQPQNDATCNGG